MIAAREILCISRQYMTTQQPHCFGVDSLKIGIF